MTVPIRWYREHFGLIVAGAAAFSMSTLFSSAKPVLITRFNEQIGFSPSLSGLIAAMPFIGIAVSSLIVGQVIKRLHYQVSAICMGLILILSQLMASQFFFAPVIVLMLQFIGGVSVGVLMGITSQVIAKTRFSHKIFGAVDGIAVLLMSFMIAGVSHAVAAKGLMGAFIFSALVCLLFFGLLFLYKSPRGDALSLDVNQPVKLAFRPVLVVLIGVAFIAFSGMGFAFMFTVARNLGLSYEYAGNSIGLILFFSAFACLAGGYVSHHFGATVPLLVAFFSCALGWFVALNTEQPWLFLCALVPAIYSIQFSFPVFLALAGELDKQGSWAAIATPLLTSGFAWAAILSGLVADAWGIKTIAWVNILGMASCAGLLVWSNLLQRAGAASAQQA